MNADWLVSVLLIALLMTTLPGLCVWNLKSALKGEPYGILLGVLLTTCLLSIVYQAPGQYHPALWVFGTLSLLPSAYIMNKS